MLGHAVHKVYGRESKRDELVRVGLTRVRRIAFRMARRLPPNVEVDDLISAGTEGLLKAVNAYDEKVNPRFEPYADTRIRGAILDELRAADPMTRHGRRRMAEVEKTIRELRQEYGTEPTEEEISARLSIPLEQFQKLMEHLARAPALGRLGEVEPDEIANAGKDPEGLLEQERLHSKLISAIGKLPQRTQLVLALYYQEECTQAEIGKILDVTESRICQLLGEATARLRSRIKSDSE
ncbi:MAG: RNA polymerase sigma factor FliA [Myxococcota bacterium]